MGFYFCSVVVGFVRTFALPYSVWQVLWSDLEAALLFLCGAVGRCFVSGSLLDRHCGMCMWMCGYYCYCGRFMRSCDSGVRPTNNYCYQVWRRQRKIDDRQVLALYPDGRLGTCSAKRPDCRLSHRRAPGEKRRKKWFHSFWRRDLAERGKQASTRHTRDCGSCYPPTPTMAALQCCPVWSVR